jgi:RNA polymerase sigma factor (sigma-70 family)
MSQSSTDLRRRFRAGEGAALAAVYQDHVPEVERLVRRGYQVPRAGGGRVWVEPGDRPDVVQEVFVKALSPAGRRGYDLARDYRPYLLSIARNTMIDWLRSRRVAPGLRARLAAEPRHEPGFPDDPPPWQHPRNLATATRYLAALPLELREVYRLRYAEGMTQERAARTLGVGRQTVRTLEQRLQRGLARTLEFQAG